MSIHIQSINFYMSFYNSLSDDDVRPPDEQIRMKLIDEYDSDEDLYEFEKRITSSTDPSLTHEIKSAMIQNKRDQMLNKKKQSNHILLSNVCNFLQRGLF